MLSLTPYQSSFAGCFYFNSQKMETIIEIDKVKKHFKDVKAVDGIDLQIKKGEYVALLGPNGAGKTTLVEMIEGIRKPDSGTIRIKGLSWKGNEEKLHRIIGLSLQETRFIDKLSVRETLRLFADFYGLGKQRVQEVLALTKLEEKQKSYVVKLSGGQKQRLALGIALLNNPELLLLDEPTTGLDPNVRREVWDILMELRKRNNTTLLLTTHYMEEASYLCDKIVIMDGGKILAQGTLQELLSAYKDGEVIDFEIDKPIDEAAIRSAGEVKEIELAANGLSGNIIVTDIVHFLPVFLNYIEKESFKLRSLECRKMTLDDLFVAMSGKHFND